MRLNEHVRIVGERVVLMPYKEEYVPKYHEWMKSPELQQLTASEPLTLEEEYEMQKTWRNDEDKLTFIILDKAKLSESQDEIEAMVGDTNLFLRQDQDSQQLLGEIEIMIAEGGARGKGFGWEATCAMLKYGMDVLKVRTFVAKIGMDNATSIRMFEKLQFEEESRSAVFNEITFTRACDPTMGEYLEKAVPGGRLNIQEIATYPAAAADR